ncbi:MAG: hypothetical protein M1829_003511 [Trizodia sp. TS-e1964]|nr:MAG: hypothetical protein M1829_003511 [Trizodia sp. TS-e1964]
MSRTKAPVPATAVHPEDRKRTRQDMSDSASSEQPQKRHRSLGVTSEYVPAGPPQGVMRSLAPYLPIAPEPTGVLNTSQHSHITHWATENAWPKEFFELEPWNYLLARRKSSPSLLRKPTESSMASFVTPSDQRPREDKSIAYNRAAYEYLLGQIAGSYMVKSRLGINDISKRLCRTLLEDGPIIPRDTLFRDDAFEKTCERLEARNETRIVQDISRLLVPSAESLATLGDMHLEHLVESVNEGWNDSIPATHPRPQPDYAVGFGWNAFNEDELSRIRPILGDLTFESYFKATSYMLFPFLTCEVKCGSAGLDIADRQNAHSMTIAVRATVELFKLVNREIELDREFLAFSVSHDHKNVRIYGHYPVMEGSKYTIWRHPIREFSFSDLEGREKWTTYTFTKNVYDKWVPEHFQRIASAISGIPPNLDLRTPPLPETEASWASGEMESLSGSDLECSMPSTSASVAPTESRVSSIRRFRASAEKAV